MASREAEIRITFKKGAAVGGLRDVEKEAKSVGAGIKSALGSSLKAGFSSAASSMKSFFGELKGHMKLAASLGGAFAVGSAIKGALDLTGRWKDLAFAIEAGTGKTVDWRSEMENAQSVAKKWALSTDDVTTAFKLLYEDIGDPAFARKGMAEVAKASRATGASVETLSKIAGQLNEKFGVTAEELPDGLAMAVSLANKGGISLEDMGEKIGMLGASAKLLGLQGTDGFRQVIAMANVADGSTGNLKKTISGVAGLLDEMSKADFGKKVKTQLGLDVTTKGRLNPDALRKIIQTTGGKQEMLAKVFTGEQLKVVSDLGKVYSETFNATKGTVEKKTHEATVAYQNALNQAAKTTMTKERMEEQAAKRAADPKAQLQRAMDLFAEQFTKPELMAAIADLAKNMPQLASAVAKVVQFVVKHPALAGAAFVGAKVGGSFAGGMAGDLALATGKKIGGAAADAMSSGAKTIGGSIAAGLEGSSKWGSVGRVIGVAAAAAIGFAIGEELSKRTTEKDIERAGKTGGGLSAAAASAHAALETGSDESKRAALAMLESKMSAAKNENALFPTSLSNVTAGDVVAGLAFGPAGLLAKRGAQGNLQSEGMSSAEKEAAALRESLAKTSSGGNKAADSMERAAKAAERFAGSLDKASAGGDVKGPMKLGGGAPGSAPRGG